MLAQIPKLRRNIGFFVLCALATTIASCANQKESVRLVDDPDDHHESTIPWNKQEKWETGGQFAGMTDRR
jgi:hypothetical protein